jgi:hypothetical protein
MSRVAASHADWLGLLEPHGQFLTLPVIREAFPGGLDRVPASQRDQVRDQLSDLADTGTAGRTGWLEYLLRDVLAWGTRLRSGPAVPADLTHTVAEKHLTLRADYALVEPATGSSPERTRALVVRFDHGTDLTARIPGEKWAASPVERVALLCRATGVPVGIATNGDLLTLVWAPLNAASGYGTWPTSLLGEEPVLLDALTSLLGAKRFFAVKADAQLDQLLSRSASAQHDVTTQLGRQVRQAVELLVSALSRANNEHGGRLLAGVDPHAVYEASVTVMMRLVFLLYAEERRLLPLGDALYDASYAASTLREELRADADSLGDEPLELRTSAWHRLLATFRAVHSGIEHDLLRLPAYGGSLFDPDRFAFLEGRHTDESWRTTTSTPLPVDDLTVLAILNALQILEIRDGGVTESRKLSFRTLDVEQIGHVYEGCLDHGAKRVETIAVGLTGRPGQEAEVPLEEVEEQARLGRVPLLTWLSERTGRSVVWLEKELDRPVTIDEQRLLRTACENDALAVQRALPFVHVLRSDLRGLPVVFLPGSVYVTETSARRDSGTEYTTKEFADEIVRHALEPLVYNPGPAQGAPAGEWRLESSAQILRLRICDPAVGSGAVIVAACRYLADRLVEAWAVEGRTGDASDTGEDPSDLLVEARRIVADQCLYGVDRDEMAVEMAKLSLWLTTMARERPFSFLDHAFRAGDSLLGLTDIRQVESLHISPNRADYELPFAEALAPRIREALVKRRALEAIPVMTMRDAEEKARLNDEADTALVMVDVVADLVAGAVLSAGLARNDVLGVRLHAARQAVSQALEVADGERGAALEALQAMADGWLNAGRPETAPVRRPLHWPVIFPEVFAEGGFSALVGNPPFLHSQKITGRFGVDYREYLIAHVAGGQRGTADLVAYFFRRAATLLRPGGTFGLIATNTISEGDTRDVGLDQLIAGGATIYRAEKSRPWPGGANLEVAQVWAAMGPYEGTPVLDGTPTPSISGKLAAAASALDAVHRLAANRGLSFQGSITLGKGFVLTPDEADQLIGEDPRSAEVIFPYYGGEDVNSRPDMDASRMVIDFLDWPEEQAARYVACYDRVLRLVKPERAKVKRKANRERWWQYAETRPAMRAAIQSLDRVLVVTLHSKHAQFAFLPRRSVFSHALMVFPYDDAFHFALLSSALHWWWVIEHGSTLETRIRYTGTDCFETFPHCEPNDEASHAGEALLEARQRAQQELSLGITDLYNLVHDPSSHLLPVADLREAHRQVDLAVAKAYGWDDLELGHDFRETRQGVRWTVASDVQYELMQRLVALNGERFASESPGPIGGKRPRPAARTAAVSDLPGTLALFPDMFDKDPS